MDSTAVLKAVFGSFRSHRRRRECPRRAAYVSTCRFAYQAYGVKFAKKCDNVAGLQMADLACYPIIHYVQNPKTERPDWLAVRSRIRHDWRGRIEGRGLKIFPSES
jgi:hypothetical protein